MFDIQTKSKSLTITGMSLCTDRVNDLSYEIYTKHKSFQDHGLVDSSVWRFIASGNVTGVGVGTGTPIPSEHFLDDHASLES
eukprot:9620854-Ditylum_brightwellii.AAC.1